MIAGYAVICVLLAAVIFWGAIAAQPPGYGGMLGAGLLLVFAYAVFRGFRWALRLAAGVLLLVAVILPVGLINPFMATEQMAAGFQSSSLAITLLWLIPLEAILLAAIWFIDPPKIRKEPERVSPPPQR
jgi:hypothetical protein